MSKPLINDKVAVVKSNPEVRTADKSVTGRFIAYVGTLKAQDRGRPTADKRAHGEEGDCPEEIEVEAKGWSVIMTEEGRRLSVPSAAVMLHSQKIVQESATTMAKVAELATIQQEEEEELRPAREFAEKSGLEVSTLTEHNLRVIFEKFGS